MHVVDTPVGLGLRALEGTYTRNTPSNQCEFNPSIIAVNRLLTEKIDISPMCHIRIQRNIIVLQQNVPQCLCVFMVRPVGPVLPSLLVSELCKQCKDAFRSTIAR